MNHTIIEKDILSVVNRLPKDKVARLSGKRVLVTGGNGFLGSYLVFALAELSRRLEKPMEIVSLDIKEKKEFSSLGVHTLVRDVTEPWDAGTASDKVPKSDFILFAAGIASPVLYRREPLKTLDITVQGLRHALEHARHYDGFQSLVYFSTSEVYGDPDPKAVPTDESYRGNVATMGPRACYDESKRLGETLAYIYQAYCKVPVKVVRPFNVFGPGLSPEDGRVLPDYLKKILRNEDVVLYSDGTPTRTFCYIEDATVGFLLALLSQAEGEVFNIGSDTEEISMKDLAKTFISVTRPHLQIHLQASSEKDYLTDNPQRRKPNLEKSRNILNYHSQVTLAEGLKRYFAYYEK